MTHSLRVGPSPGVLSVNWTPGTRCRCRCVAVAELQQESPFQCIHPLLCCTSLYRSSIPLQLKRYNESLLSKASELNSRWKWEDKRQEVFARFSNYRRHVHVNMPGLERKGAR